MAYTTFGFDGAMVTATRPQGFAGSPLALLSSSSFQVVPPSAVWKKPLPLGAAGLSPPGRKGQPFPPKTPMPAENTFGASAFIEINDHRANGLRRLFVKTRLECRAAVRGFPYAPAGGSNVDSKPAILFYGGDRGHAPAHGGGADVPRTKTRDRVRIEFAFLRRCSPGKNHRREKHHHHRSKTPKCLAHIGGFLSNKVEATALGHKSIVRGTGISSCPLVRNHFPAGGAFVSGLETGIEKCASSSGIFCSIFSTEICERDALPFCACSTAKG